MTEKDPDVRIHVDLVYSQAGGVARLADVYIPNRGSELPAVVIWVHGGGWRFGDRHLSPDLEKFARNSGLAVVSIDYRLSDEATFPAPVVDVKAAVRWVRSIAQSFGVSGARIGLWGSSAGAHLAACAALSQEEDFLSQEHAGLSSAVHAVVDGYGPTNFAQIDEARGAVRSTGSDAESIVVGGLLPAGDPNSFESRFIGAAVSSSHEMVELADPVHYVKRDSPPFLILHGEADSLIPPSQSRYLFEALSAAGNEASLVLFEKLKHGFFNNLDSPQEEYGEVRSYAAPGIQGRHAKWVFRSSESIYQMVSGFLRAHLAPDGAPVELIR